MLDCCSGVVDVGGVYLPVAKERVEAREAAGIEGREAR